MLSLLLYRMTVLKRIILLFFFYANQHKKLLHKINNTIKNKQLNKIYQGLIEKTLNKDRGLVTASKPNK